MYNKKSLKAEEFINHDEILRTLEFAEKNKKQVAPVTSVILARQACS